MNQTDWDQVEATWKDLGFNVDVLEEAKTTTLGDAMLRLAPYVEPLKAEVNELRAENEVLQRELQKCQSARLSAPDTER